MHQCLGNNNHILQQFIQNSPRNGLDELFGTVVVVVVLIFVVVAIVVVVVVVVIIIIVIVVVVIVIVVVVVVVLSIAKSTENLYFYQPFDE